MPIVLRLALLLDISSIWFETCFPGLHAVWPFTLDHLVRIALLLLGAAIVIELLSIVRSAIRKLRDKARPDRQETDN